MAYCTRIPGLRTEIIGYTDTSVTQLPFTHMTSVYSHMHGQLRVHNTKNAYVYTVLYTPIKSIVPLCQHQIHQRVTNGTALAHDFVKTTNLYLNQLISITGRSVRQIIARIIEDRRLEYLSHRRKSHPWGAMGMVGTFRSCCEVSLSILESKPIQTAKEI
jgi:hypothetical protein